MVGFGLGHKPCGHRQPLRPRRSHGGDPSLSGWGESIRPRQVARQPRPPAFVALGRPSFGVARKSRAKMRRSLAINTFRNNIIVRTKYIDHQPPPSMTDHFVGIRKIEACERYLRMVENANDAENWEINANGGIRKGWSKLLRGRGPTHCQRPSATAHVVCSSKRDDTRVEADRADSQRRILVLLVAHTLVLGHLPMPGPCSLQCISIGCRVHRARGWLKRL